MRPFRLTADQVVLVRALVDVRVWESLREHGLGPDAAVEAASQALEAALAGGSAPR